MDPRDLDDYMRRTTAHLIALQDRVAQLEEREALAVPVWDDIQVSISQLRIPTANAPTWRTWNYGIGGGVQFSILGFDVNETVDLFIQTSHAMKLQSILDYHMHWSVPTNSAGDRFQVQIDAIAAGLDSPFAVVSGSPFTTEYTLDGSESGDHKLLDLAEMDGENPTISTAFIMKFTRIAASVNEYSGELYVVFTDGHYLRDALGSRLENEK